MARFRTLLLEVLLPLLFTPGTTGLASPAPEPGRYFAIEVLDEATGRGVPMVELQTTSGARWYTDSSGLVAFDEPGIMDKKVWFFVSAHGYEFPPHGFGMRGATLETKPGGNDTRSSRSSASTSPNASTGSPGRGSIATRCCWAAGRRSPSPF